MRKFCLSSIAEEIEHAGSRTGGEGNAIKRAIKVDLIEAKV